MLPPLQSVLADIVVRASSLHERLDHGFPAGLDQSVCSEQARERLARWCLVSAQGDDERFRRRLDWDGLDAHRALVLLDRRPSANGELVPGWAQTLREIVCLAASVPPQHKAPCSVDSPELSRALCLDPAHPVPFEDALLPAVEAARQKLLGRLGFPSLSFRSPPLGLLSASAYRDLERYLLLRLADLCAEALQDAFARSRPSGHNLLCLLVGETAGSPGTDRYAAFVGGLLQDGLLGIFREYPVLGRLVATLCDFWVETTAEFLERLRTDWRDIEHVFSSAVSEENGDSKAEGHRPRLGTVVDVRIPLSAPHERGRTVIGLTFASGLRLVYKPRDIGQEAVYNDLLAWLNAHGASLPFKTLRVIHREAYGWVEHVQRRPCDSAAAAVRFYRRAGMLLGLLYGLGGTDGHDENLVAHGEHPVLIDVETLISPGGRPLVDDAEGSEAAARTRLVESVLGTGLLPLGSFVTGDAIHDCPGLPVRKPSPVSRRVRRWRAINTDQMQVTDQSSPSATGDNVPMLGETALCAQQHVHDVVEGFRQMYHLLLALRPALLADDGPLGALKRHSVRYVFRTGIAYAAVLRRSIAPDALRDGLDRSIELDRLSGTLLKAAEKPATWPVIRAEQRALDQLDIPRFGAAADSTTLILGVEEHIACVCEPAWDRMRRRLCTLDELDLARQVSIIHGALGADRDTDR